MRNEIFAQLVRVTYIHVQIFFEETFYNVIWLSQVSAVNKNNSV